MKILHISDTHTYHKQLQIDESVDVIVHSGDCTNSKDVNENYNEFVDFFEWFKGINKPKVLVAGNHDSFIYHNEKFVKGLCEKNNIFYLNKSSVEINGIMFYGEPITPIYGEWFFMAKREKMSNHWKQIPDNTNILITHGPPQGILDLTQNRDNQLELCGCSNLNKKIKTLPNLKAVLFGHIHDCGRVKNNGVLVRDNIIYSNGALVEDGKFNKGVIHNGNIIEI